MATKILKLYKTEENEDECCYQNENFTQYQSNDYNQFFIKQCDNRLLIKYSRDCIKSSCYAKKLKMTQNSRNNLYAFLYGIIVSIFQISNSKSLRTQSFPRSSRSFSIMPTQSLPIIVLVFLQLNCLLSCSRFGLVMANKIDVLANELEYDSNILPTGHFTHTWAVHIPNGDSGLADRVAEDHGFMNMGKIIGDHYHFIHHKVAKRSLTPSDHHQSRLHNDDRVHWSAQQLAKSRQKRDFIRMRPSRTSSKAMSLVDSIQLNDPKWSQMWYLNRGGGLDMNVIPAWKEGITGKGVVVTILDDGLESDHPDIEQNYDPKASYDVNSHDEDPMPHYDMTDSNRHGTRCAGEVAATANNTICAVGIAFGASVGGVRMLDGDVTDAVEARSLSLNPSHIDIYSASWGPDDDGKTVDGPGELASRAFIEGVNNGRKGKGSIFIWASGNGGRELDNCNCDGYTNSIWTLSISSATEEGHVPWYSEKCSSTLATTYSSGGQGEKQVVTTDLHHSCTVSHTGTSASAPLAAGIAALALEANGNLTWRDLQHIVVRTAKPANLKDTTWSRNGVGRRVSHSFGYGLMDAAGMVKAARTWKTVPEQQRCEINAPHVDKFIPPRSYITLRLVVKHCSSVNFLEHVQAKITLTSQRRGDIQLFLTSPAGTKVTLLTSRIHDVSRSGFSQWPFMSVHTWGEAPQGDWQLEIHNEGRFMGHAMLREWSLIFYGTTNPVDPNDPISIRPTPSTNSTLAASSSSTNLHQIYSPQYPRIPPSSHNSYLSNLLLNKSNSKLNSLFLGNINGNDNGRKQQQNQHQQQNQQQQQPYHQISATYGVILASPKNKAKSSKNNSSNGKPTGKNSNGNGGPKSSNRPHSQVSPSGSKNAFYRVPTANNNNNSIRTSSTTVKIGSTTQRPKLELQSNYNANPDIGRGGKLLKGKDKLSIKAAKQVKETNAANSPTLLPPVIAGDILDTLMSSSSATEDKSPEATQKIPKLFQQYDKIQQIFPEFQPYALPKNSKLRIQTSAENVASSFTSSLPVQRQGQNRKQFQFFESPGMIGGGKSIFNNSTAKSGITRNNGGARNSSTNPKPSRENSKKSFQQLSPSVMAAGIEQIQEQNSNNYKIYIPNKKATNAQITQWDLIFYGTEKPAQPDDPIHISPAQVNSYGSDIEHNGLEYDSDTASGQWRDMHQVGESRADIQRMANDQTNSACQKFAYDQRCIECAITTILFKDRCYLSCPDRFFVTTTEVSKDQKNDDIANLNEFQEIKAKTLMSDRRRCESCHSSCLRCKGVNVYDCTSCFSGSQLRIISSNESYCYVFAERSSGSNKDISDSHKINATGIDGIVFLIVLLPIAALLILAAYVFIFGKGLSWTGKRVNYVYDRVSLQVPDEEIQFLTNDINDDENDTPKVNQTVKNEQ